MGGDSLSRVGENATITKIRAIHGKMLISEDYKALSAKRSIAEVAQFLQSHRRFEAALSDIDPNTVNRDYLEELLQRLNFEMFLRLRDFQHLKHIGFYNSTCERYELEQLLSLIGTVGRGEKYDFVKTLPAFFLPETELDFLDMSKSESFAELCERLEKTKYSRLAEELKSACGDVPDILTAEVCVRSFFYRRLFKSIKDELPKAEAEILSDEIKRDIDMRNIVNAYRLKTYFDMSADELKKKSLPFSKMSRARIERLYECESGEKMLQFLPEYKKAGSQPFEFVETVMSQIRLKRAKKLMRYQSLPLVFYAFMEICDIEADNITHIIEGIRYGLKPDKIEQLVAY